jgi:hypothetical protein
MSYGLNVEMHKQTEIAKRLNAICAQLTPFLSQEVRLKRCYSLAYTAVNLTLLSLFSTNSKYSTPSNEPNKSQWPTSMQLLA